MRSVKGTILYIYTAILFFGIFHFLEWTTKQYVGYSEGFPIMRMEKITGIKINWFLMFFIAGVVDSVKQDYRDFKNQKK